MRKPIENVVRIRGIEVQPIKSLSWATERKVRCHFYTRYYYAQFKTQTCADKLMRYNEEHGLVFLVICFMVNYRKYEQNIQKGTS